MDDSPPAVFRHATAFYRALKKGSKMEEMNGDEVRVFKGKLTEVFKELGISQSYYSPITRSLVANGCYEQINKGARGQPTTLILKAPPSRDTWEVVKNEKKLDIPVVAQRLDNIERNMGGLNVPVALVDLQRQIHQIRRDLNDLRDEIKAGGNSIATE